MITLKLPNFIGDLLDGLNSTESTTMACQCMLASLCYTHQTLKGHIHSMIQRMASDSQEQFALMDKLKITQEVLSNYITSEVESRLGSAASVLTNQHLMQINEEGDEGLFYEIWYNTLEGSSEITQSNIKPHSTKKSSVWRDQTLIDKEIHIFRSIK